MHRLPVLLVPLGRCVKREGDEQERAAHDGVVSHAAPGNQRRPLGSGIRVPSVMRPELEKTDRGGCDEAQGDDFGERKAVRGGASRAGC